MSDIAFKPFTIVFDTDIQEIKENPFQIETVFGTPIAIARGDVTAKVCELEAEVAALKEEAEQRRMLYDGRFKELVEARLLSAGPDGKGGFDINIQGQIVPLLAEALAADFKSSGGENYVEYEVHHPELGVMAFTLQLKSGITPAQKACNLEEENKVLREAAKKAFVWIMQKGMPGVSPDRYEAVQDCLDVMLEAFADIKPSAEDVARSAAKTEGCKE